MRIALAQINATIGDFDGNLARIRAAAAEVDASLVVFPELAICGYMPRDLLEESAFLARCDRALAELAAEPGLPPLLVGCPVRTDPPGKRVLNAAVLVRDGTTVVVAKRLLPTYDVFDERRYFEPGGIAEPVDIDGVSVGVTICEDIWTGGLYARDPVAELVERGARVILNLSASPYRRDVPALRRKVFAEHARRHGVPVALCNLVGGNDQLIFDGNSFALDREGRACTHAAAFREEVCLVDFEARAEVPEEHVSDAIVLGIRDYFGKTGFEDAIVGMSGGIDSSLVACLGVEALGRDHVTGVGMPGPFSADQSLEDARILAETLGIRFEVIPIAESYQILRGELQEVWGHAPFGVPEENLQARLRGTILMALANRASALVLATSNKSELALGYCTLYGDMVGGLAPIADLYKTEVYDLARRFEIPSRVIERAPTAELAPDQTDQDTLPPYDVLDAILRLHLEQRLSLDEIVDRGFERATVERILRGVSTSEYKRQQASPVLKLTEKAFGLGRRYPITEVFRGGTT